MELISFQTLCYVWTALFYSRGYASEEGVVAFVKYACMYRHHYIQSPLNMKDECKRLTCAISERKLTIEVCADSGPYNSSCSTGKVPGKRFPAPDEKPLISLVDVVEEFVEFQVVVITDRKLVTADDVRSHQEQDGERNHSSSTAPRAGLVETGFQITSRTTGTWPEPEAVKFQDFQDEEIRRRQKKDFDSRHAATVLPPLEPGDTVWVRDIKETAGVLSPASKPRSYVVETPTVVLVPTINGIITHYTAEGAPEFTDYAHPVKSTGHWSAPAKYIFGTCKNGTCRYAKQKIIHETKLNTPCTSVRTYKGNTYIGVEGCPIFSESKLTNCTKLNDGDKSDRGKEETLPSGSTLTGTKGCANTVELAFADYFSSIDPCRTAICHLQKRAVEVVTA
ncbi:hypothetical protein MTO96_036292 [Rhipicephalus appendiculatus]